MKFFLPLCVAILALQPVYANSLTTTEKQIATYITQQKQQQLSLIKELVNINSGTMNITGVQKTGALLKQQLDQVGFKTYWISEPNRMNRAPTLVAEHQGNKGKRLLLIGHLDTVFPKDSPFQVFSQQGKFATGPGVIDDKGSDAVLLYALKALARVHALDDATITVILTGDEEDSGKPTTVSRKPLFAAAQRSDVALDFEWSFTADTATIARRGISNWTLETKGNEAHSSEIFQKTAGDGAIFEAARILNSMRSALANEKYLSFSPGLILGGTAINYDSKHSEGTAFGKGNVIAKTAVIKGDLRFLTNAQKLNAENKITTIINQHLPGTTATIQFQDGIPAMPPTTQNLDLLKQYSQVSKELGYGRVKAMDPGLRGAGDISHIAAMVSANLAGLGAIGTGAHSTNETLDIDTLPMQTQRAALLIYRLIQ